ncbi:iron-siderophore ABC transporter substrate-binding protein [Corynebacterium terpenotabidum]|uniref:Fe/B12 periplasmic-binding domain-containing protein n=1 Tax=Corynebacterium terpenotabidum Y-11 TaxID=1200352 RepID=S4XGB3_9CORY|nr:iron-siderophore ABC transporter substrate-binding protein [Corynebacterium terpenotabidum]AGP29698.1 hypothetical protein A606_00200 [Corynebacterium terpenotabidum Y-11]
MTIRRLPLAALATLSSLSLVLTACSSDDEDASSSAGATASVAGDTGVSVNQASYPVTFTSPWGDSTLEEAPTRIATIGYKDADILASLGEVPVLMGDSTLNQEVWTVDAFAGAEPEKTFTYADDGSIDIEQLAAAEPDLIVASQMDLSDNYDELSKIAPVIAAETEDDISGNWQQTLTSLGEALGKQADAAQVIEDTTQAAATVREEHPEFDGKSISMLNYFGLDTIRYLNAAGTDAAKLMESIGFTTIDGSDGFGSDNISAERLDDTAADVMVILDNSQGQIDDLLSNPTFQAIPAVQEGRVLVIHNKAFDTGESAFTVNDDDEQQKGNLAWALGYPGPLSTQWALETLAPLLKNTVEGTSADDSQ